MYEVSPSSAALCTTSSWGSTSASSTARAIGPQLALGELVRERREIALLVADAETDAVHGGPRFSTVN